MDEFKFWDEARERRFDKSIQVGAFLGGFILAALTSLIALGVDNPIFCTEPITSQTSPDITRSQFCNAVSQIGKDHPDITWVDYRQVVIGAIGVVGALFIISVYGMKRAYVLRYLNRYADYSHTLYELGFIGILLIFPFIVMPYSLMFGLVIAGVAWVWVAWYIYHADRESSIQVSRHIEDFMKLKGNPSRSHRISSKLGGRIYL